MTNLTHPMIEIPFIHERPTPPFEGDDIRYPEELVRHFLKSYTKKGDRIFDPFAGLGTTLFVGEEMGREAYGIEYDERRHAWVAGQLEHWNRLVCGDAAKIGAYGFPKMDFCMTSPPYMPNWHKWNPLYAGNPKFAGYERYLRQIGRIFAQIHPIMKKKARLIVQADNLLHPNGHKYTPLVADLAREIGKTFNLEGEIIVKWDKTGKKASKDTPDGYTHTHCLIFRP